MTAIDNYIYILLSLPIKYCQWSILVLRLAIFSIAGSGSFVPSNQQHQAKGKGKSKPPDDESSARSQGLKKRRLEDSVKEPCSSKEPGGEILVTQSHFNSDSESDESQDEDWIALLPTKAHRLQKPGTKRGAKVSMRI